MSTKDIQIDLRGILSVIMFIAFLIALYYAITNGNKNDILLHEIDSFLDEQIETDEKIESYMDSIELHKHQIKLMEAQIQDLSLKTTSNTTEENYAYINDNTPPKTDTVIYEIEGSNKIDYIAQSLEAVVYFKGQNELLKSINKEKDKLILSLDNQNAILKYQNKSYHSEIKRIRKDMTSSKRRNTITWIVGGVIMTAVIVLN
jgi:hypothetical protein